MRRGCEKWNYLADPRRREFGMDRSCLKWRRTRKRGGGKKSSSVDVLKGSGAVAGGAMRSVFILEKFARRLSSYACEQTKGKLEV